MKQPSYIPCVVLTADQRGSRSDVDRVPDLLTALSVVPTLAAFERTAGDEVQGVFAAGAPAVAACELLLRTGHWRAGVGIGLAETPLPASPREGRGPAFIAARTAVEAAHGSPRLVAVRAGGMPVGARPYGRDDTAGDDTTTDDTDPMAAASDAEAALWLLADVWRRRTPEGWEVVDLMTQGLSGREAARRLDISPSAVSQRATIARHVEGLRGAQLTARLIDRTLGLVAAAASPAGRGLEA